MGKCLFCEQSATKQRYYNMVMVDLCSDHYYSENIGRIAQRVRELKEKDNGDDTEIPSSGIQEGEPQVTQSQDGRKNPQAGRPQGRRKRVKI